MYGYYLLWKAKKKKSIEKNHATEILVSWSVGGTFFFNNNIKIMQ